MIIGNPAMFPEMQIEDALERMKSLGFGGVEIGAPIIQACTTDGLKKQFAAYIRSLELKVVRLNTAGADYFTPLSHPGEVARIVEGLKRDIDTTTKFGVDHLTTWEGRPHTGVSATDIHGWVLDATTRLFEQAVDYARMRNVRLSVEVHPKSLGKDVQWLKKLCDRLESSWFTVTYDCAHFGVAVPGDYINAIRVLGRSIGHLDFCDSDMESQNLHLAPGTGNLDLNGIVQALKEGMFRGSCMLDLGGCLLPVEGARTGIPYLRSVMERLGID